jgi:hypothetical protein
MMAALLHTKAPYIGECGRPGGRSAHLFTMRGPAANRGCVHALLMQRSRPNGRRGGDGAAAAALCMPRRGAAAAAAAAAAGPDSGGSGSGGSGSGGDDGGGGEASHDEAYYDGLSDAELKKVSYTRYAERRKRRVEERDAARLTEDERARRTKIGEANKGRVPWNKGRKHSPGAHGAAGSIERHAALWPRAAGRGLGSPDAQKAAAQSRACR